METPPVPLNMEKRVNMRYSIGSSLCFYKNKNIENFVSEFQKETWEFHTTAFLNV